MRKPYYNILSRRGLSLIEMTVTLAFLSISMPAVGYLFGLGVKEDSHNSAEAQAYFLANALMNEISRHRFRESAAAPGNGPEVGELAGFDRRNFDDIDDYQAFQSTWTGGLTPPRDEAGAVMAGFSQFKQEVEVYNIPNVPAGPGSRSTAKVGDGTTDFKVVTVRVSWDRGARRINLAKIFALR